MEERTQRRCLGCLFHPEVNMMPISKDTSGCWMSVTQIWQLAALESHPAV